MPKEFNFGKKKTFLEQMEAAELGVSREFKARGKKVAQRHIGILNILIGVFHIAVNSRTLPKTHGYNLIELVVSIFEDEKYIDTLKKTAANTIVSSRNWQPLRGKLWEKYMVCFEVMAMICDVLRKQKSLTKLQYDQLGNLMTDIINQQICDGK